MNNLFSFLPGLKIDPSGMEFNNGDGTKTVVTVINGQDPVPGLPLFHQAEPQRPEPDHHHPQPYQVSPAYPMPFVPWPYQQQQVCVQPQPPQPKPPPQPNILVIEKEAIPKTPQELEMIREMQMMDEEDKRRKIIADYKKQEKIKAVMGTEREKAMYPLPFSRFSVASALLFALGLILGCVTISLTSGLEKEYDACHGSAGSMQRRAHVVVIEDTHQHADVNLEVNRTQNNDTVVTEPVLDNATSATTTAAKKLALAAAAADSGQCASHRRDAVAVGFTTVVAFTLATLGSLFAGVQNENVSSYKKKHALQVFALVISCVLLAVCFLSNLVILTMALDPDTRPITLGVIVCYSGNIISWVLMFGYSEMTRRWIK